QRIHQDSPAGCGASPAEVAGGRLTTARLAYGGMAPIPARAPHAERALVGLPSSEVTIDSATAALAADFTPLTDSRASRAYRLRAAGSMLRRFYLQHSPAPLTLRVTDPSAAMEFTYGR